jgi:hypothetical protein
MLLGPAFAAANVVTGCQLLKSQATGEDASAVASNAAAPTQPPGETAPAETATATANATSTGARPTPKAATATATAAATGTPGAAPKPAEAPDAGASPSGACESIAGTWGTRGTCGPDTCIVTQTGCATNFKCRDGAASYTGVVNGKGITYKGVTGTCSGTLSPDSKTINGSCQSVVGVPCAFVATKR